MTLAWHASEQPVALAGGGPAWLSILAAVVEVGVQLAVRWKRRADQPEGGAGELGGGSRCPY